MKRCEDSYREALYYAAALAEVYAEQAVRHDDPRGATALSTLSARLKQYAKECRDYPEISPTSD